MEDRLPPELPLLFSFFPNDDVLWLFNSKFPVVRYARLGFPLKGVEQ